VLNRVFKQTKEKKIKKFFGQSLEEALRRSGRLQKVSVSEFSGWIDYVQILNDYVDKVKKRKALLRFDQATQEDIDATKYLDHEAWFIENYIKPLVNNFVSGLDAAVKKQQREEDKQNV